MSSSSSTEILHLAQLLKRCKNIVLSTHRQADGDGLGAQVALYYALKKSGKSVRILNVDAPPKKYQFLNTQDLVESFEDGATLSSSVDAVLIFDTNDQRLLGPLFAEFEKHSQQIAFIDHHPILNKGPLPTQGSYIDTSAASTGQIAFELITAMEIPLDEKIARAIYSSIVFDTQLFRYIRNSPRSHLIAAELLKYEKNPDEVHRNLFAHHTVEKIRFLSKALGSIEFFADNRIAILKVTLQDLLDNQLEMDDSRDVIDMIMNIASLEVAVLIREDGPNDLKVSIRSKGNYAVLDLAEKFGGGGHRFSSGAFVTGNYEELKQKIAREVVSLIDSTPQ